MSEIKISNIKTIITEYQLFEKVSIKAFVKEVSLITSTKVCDKCINMQAALVHDKSGTSSITLFDMNCNQIQNSSSCVFTNLSSSQYLSPRLLKKTEVTTIQETNIEDIDLDSRQCGNKETVKGKIVSADLDTLRGKNMPKMKIRSNS